MTVREFLRKRTNVSELCVVKYAGYIVMTAWIDCEDLFALNDDIADKTVKSDTWGTIRIRNHEGNVVEVDCHYINT